MDRNLVIKYENRGGFLCGTLMVEETQAVIVRVASSARFVCSYENEVKALKRKIAEYLAEQLLNIMEE